MTVNFQALGDTREYEQYRALEHVELYDTGLQIGKDGVTAQNIQEKTSILPDYSLPDSESTAGTSISGIVGSVMVAGVALLICFAGGFFRKKRHKA